MRMPGPARVAHKYMRAWMQPNLWAHGVVVSHPLRTQQVPIMRPCHDVLSFQAQGPPTQRKNVAAVLASQPPWHHGYGVGLLIQRLWARIPQGVRG